MGHNINALVSRLPCRDGSLAAIRATAARFGLPLLEEGGFAIVGLDPDHATEWAKRLGLPDGPDEAMLLDLPVTHAFAECLFEGEPYALIETDYAGGVGEQSAGVFRGGERVFMAIQGVKRLDLDALRAHGPINAALRLIGVEAESGDDEFRVLGLDRHRDFDNFF